MKFKVNAAALQSAFRCIDKQQLRPSFKGVIFEFSTGTLYATNGHYAFRAVNAIPKLKLAKRVLEFSQLPKLKKKENEFEIDLDTEFVSSESASVKVTPVGCQEIAIADVGHVFTSIVDNKPPLAVEKASFQAAYLALVSTKVFPKHYLRSTFFGDLEAMLIETTPPRDPDICEQFIIMPINEDRV